MITSAISSVYGSEPRLISLIQNKPQTRRLKKKLIPTPLVKSLQCKEIQLVQQSLKVKNGRERKIIWQLLRFVIWFNKESKKTDFDAAAAGIRARSLLERFGGIWIKVGQLISLRNDALPADFCDELSKLQHRAIGFPVQIARAIIEKELGKSIDEVFQSFDDIPIAAASICQVHQGVLLDGSEVAIKVQRPDVDSLFEVDMQVFRRIIAWLERFKIMEPLRWRDGLEELKFMMREEVDFRYEADNCRRMRKSLKKHGIYVPYVYQKLSTRRILVMEFLHGVLMSEFLEARKQSPNLAQDWLYENNIDPEKIGRKLYGTAMRQLLEDNLFHADLHPGNIMLLRNNRLALIDLGTIGQLDFEFLTLYKLSQKVMASGDLGQAVDLGLRLCPEIPAVNVDELRRNLVITYRNWMSRARLKGLSFKEKSLTAASQDAGRIMYAYGIPASWTLLRVTRTWSTLDASLKELINDVDYIDLMKRYFKAAQKRENHPNDIAKRMKRGMSDVIDAQASYSVLQAPLMRRQALIYSMGAGKASSFAASLFGLISILLFLTGLAFLLAVGTRHSVMIDAALSHLPLTYDLVDSMPEFSISIFVALAVLSFILSIWARNMKANFSAVEIDK